MFKARLKEAAAWVLALIIVIVIVAIPLGLVALTGFINKELPSIIWAIVIIAVWGTWFGYYIWKWIKWQFVEPYKAAKAEKQNKGE